MGEKDSQRLTTLTISGLRSGLSPLTSRQARYRRMGNRLGPLQLKVNPGSGALAGRSTWSQDAARHDPSQRVPSCDMGSE